MTRKAVLLSITEDADEMTALLRTLDVEIEKTVVQKRPSPHRNTFLGPGRIGEVSDELDWNEIDLVVANGILKPSQHHTLEMRFKKECVDRVGVILKIFAEHAHTAEAKRQVTLATLRYELPFLREWIHKAKSGERPGFLSGGAYATEVYYEHSKSHIRRIEEELAIRSRQRDLRRKRRRREGYFLVSLAGYTNAGKSAILNALCKSQVEVDGRLFSTLSTTTRRLMGSSENLLLTDTVGFIRDLPPDLVNAFNSTLEEMFLSDLILLIVDVSEPLDIVCRKLAISNAILTPRLQGQAVFIVGNKVDRVSPTETRCIEDEIKRTTMSNHVFLVSAVALTGLGTLIEAIENAVGRDCRIEAVLPLTDEAFSLISALHALADVEQSTLSNQTHLTLTCSERNLAKIKAQLTAAGGEVTAVRTSARTVADL